MLTLQTLRRSRGLTLVELALLTGVPARTLGALECGVVSFDPNLRRQLAVAFGIAPSLLSQMPPPPLTQHSAHAAVQFWTPPLAAAILAGVLAFAPGAEHRMAAMQFLVHDTTRPAAEALQPPAAPVTTFPTMAPAAQARLADYGAALLRSPDPQPARPVAAAAPARAAFSTANERVAVMVDPQDADERRDLRSDAQAAARLPVPAVSALAAVGRKQQPVPRGCPLRPASGRVVLTQGYGVGTHAPADRWGAVDLALDTDGDGYAEPDGSNGVPVVATHAGRVHLYPNSWPGGNFVRIEDSANGWVTAYGHLAQVHVRDGEWVTAGTQIGTVGSTGYSTGPHLHYEVWQNGINIDPTPMVDCE